MKTIYKLALILPLLALVSAWSPASGQLRHSAELRYTLYPPLNLAVTGIECAAYITWQKPQTPGGMTPAGLAGYFIYRDGVNITYINGADILQYFDHETGWGTFTYTVTANYDLTAYGLPGQFGESPPAGPFVLILNCSIVLPFTEPWDQGTFSFNNWQFVPSQSNWAINTSDGNPPPTCIFNGAPAVQSYNTLMESEFLPGESWTCASMFLEFDLRLNDITATGTEKLSVQYKIDATWYTLSDFINTGTTGWTHYKLEFSEACGHKFRIGFRVSGQNSANIGGWMIDNILVHAECKPPTNTVYTRTGNEIHLEWQPACDSLSWYSGYNLYRTNETGNPPYIKLNPTLIAGNWYFDYIPPWITNGVFRYIICTEIHDTVTGGFLCESPGDSVTVDYALVIKTAGKTGIDIHPQPARDYLTVRSGLLVESCELLNLTGQVENSLPAFQGEVTISVSGLAGGIYLLRLQTEAGTIVRKVVVAH